MSHRPENFDPQSRIVIVVALILLAVIIVAGAREIASTPPMSRPAAAMAPARDGTPGMTADERTSAHESPAARGGPFN
jgi:hypothetical protein